VEEYYTSLMNRDFFHGFLNKYKILLDEFKDNMRTIGCSKWCLYSDDWQMDWKLLKDLKIQIQLHNSICTLNNHNHNKLIQMDIYIIMDGDRRAWITIVVFVAVLSHKRQMGSNIM